MFSRERAAIYGTEGGVPVGEVRFGDCSGDVQHNFTEVLGFQEKLVSVGGCVWPYYLLPQVYNVTVSQSLPFALEAACVFPLTLEKSDT